MNFVLTLILFGTCFILMAIGLIIAKKPLKKGCSTDPEDCACLKEGKDPEKCDQ